MKKIKIGILGAGTWGIALARMLSLSGHVVSVWSPIESEINELTSKREHSKLPGVSIPQNIEFSSEISIICAGKDILLFAVPSVFIRDTVNKAQKYISSEQIIVDVAKGIESDTMYTMTEVIRDELQKHATGELPQVVALSGPTHAEEVAFDKPTTIVSACSDLKTAEFIQSVFSNTCMRVYTNCDTKGVEVCGALKNVIALAAGISSGLGFGDNTKAALITRGMAEITRLGLAMGCCEQTFYGLAGIGDLIVTATSIHSRNNKCGYLIGKGMCVEDAIRETNMVVEGINALPAAIRLSHVYGIDMPIISSTNRIINEGSNPRMEVNSLMNRRSISEIESRCDSDVELESVLLKNTRSREMKRVITYGTFDLLHYGHINLLKRAKALGDYLVVVLSSDEFNWNEKQKKCYFTYEQRKALLESIRYVDLVIPETCWEQKKSDVHEYHIDTFVMGDDWKGKFDFLEEEGCEVVYLPRTPEISTTQIKQDLNRK